MQKVKIINFTILIIEINSTLYYSYFLKQEYMKNVLSQTPQQIRRCYSEAKFKNS